jgi:uncharacterized membrane protein YfcA
MPARLRAPLIGIVAGVVSGLFGVGGGVVVVPGLVLWMGLDQRKAAATSLATIAASAGAALVVFGRSSAVDWSAAGLLLVGATAGSWWAARSLHRVSTRTLTWAFAALMLIAAARLAVA